MNEFIILLYFYPYFSGKDRQTPFKGCTSIHTLTWQKIIKKKERKMIRSRRKKKVRSSKSNLFSLYISPPTTTFSSKPPNHHHRAAAVLTAYLLCLQCTFLAQHLHIGNSLLLFKKKKRETHSCSFCNCSCNKFALRFQHYLRCYVCKPCHGMDM